MQVRIPLGGALLALLVSFPATAQSPAPEEKHEFRGKNLPELARRLTEAACAGKRLVSVTGEEGEIVVQLEALAAEQTRSAEARPCEYRFAEATKHGQWEKEINRVAAEGFRVVTTLVTWKSVWTEWFVALLARTATPEDKYDYRVFEGPHFGRIEKKLKPAAAEGFRLLAFGLHTHTREWTWALSNQHLLLVVERKAGQPGCGARVLDTRRESTMEKELAQAAAEGYVPIHRLLHVGHYAAILERRECRPEQAAQ